MAGAEAAITNNTLSELARNRGHISITKHWARSLLLSMGFVKNIKDAFFEKVSTVVKQHNIPDCIIINWDQTVCKLVPGGECTLEARGYKQVLVFPHLMTRNRIDFTHNNKLRNSPAPTSHLRREE
ncbi:hypothetical protein CHS0354_015068 [Potamilus streckersoni]|uniref:Uncharacterized protein n=1 Tax=Potamilus streckersoni TaxID=2493646 RepID=A0AAE0TGD3_9BIVA|nr:hypothetical protein CHS0354_015068 [Potamilus streckersoni]